MAAQLSSTTTLWFIDYRLKRKAIAPTQRQARQQQCTFYGSDRQLVEVMMGTFDMDHDKWAIVSGEGDGDGEISLETERDIPTEATDSIVSKPWDLTLSVSEDDGECSSSADSHERHGEFSNGENDVPFSELESEWLFRGDWFLNKIEEAIERAADTWVTRYFDIAAPAIGRDGAKFGLLACEYV